MATLDAICLSERKGTRKQRTEAACLQADHGLVGDAHAGDWHRQVSLLSRRDIDYMRAKGLSRLVDGAFGENLITEGLDLGMLGLGSRLQLGGEAELRITQIGKACHSRCAIYHQAGDCIMPSRGLFARVAVGGPIRVGDEIRLLEVIPRQHFQAVVLTISDRCSRGEAADTAGPAVARLLVTELDAHVYTSEIVPDVQPTIASRLEHYSKGHSIDLILAVGGTGFAPRDVTPEAVAQVIDRPTPGLDEVMREASRRQTPHAMLSRAISGLAGSTLIISLPGSERAATENLRAILPALPHGLRKLRGDPSDCAPDRGGSAKTGATTA